MPHRDFHWRLVLRNVGKADGSIIATIMASHMSWKPMADATQVCSFIRIHIMDIVHPPGMCIPPPIVRQK